MLAFKRIAVVLITATFTFNINAANILGGEITWECANDSMYIFTLVIYRDCAGPVLPTGSQFIQGPAGTIMCNYIPALSGDITPGNGGTSCLTCAAGDYGAIEMGVYRSSPLSLSGTPPPLGWEFSWTNCCRPVSENSNISSIYLRSKMYPYTAPGQTNPNDVSTCYDNGPAFGEPAATVFCPNTSYSYSSKPFDLDSDSLHVYWAMPYTGAFSPGTYNVGYHSGSPLPNSSQNSANIGPNLNSQTGILSGSTQSPSSGWYIMGLGIKAYRDSQLIAEVVRDLHRNDEQRATVLEYGSALMDELKAEGIRVKLDDRDNYKPGFKFAEHEAQGVPLRIAVGPRDVENNNVELARRDTFEKNIESREGLVPKVKSLLEIIQDDLYKTALKRREELTSIVDSYEEFKKVLDDKGGFIYAHWDGTAETEELIKNETKATIRLIPFGDGEEGTCMVTGKPSKKRVVFARSY